MADNKEVEQHPSSSEDNNTSDTPLENQERVEGDNTEEEEDGIANGVDYKEWNGVDIIESLCMSCGANGETRLMLHKIPYFRELVIASFACEECGERNNEVTFGGEIQVQGSVYELHITRAKDLDRQIIKSDSAALRIRELEFEIPPKTQKGEITTIEGVLRVAAKNLSHMQPLRYIETPDVAKRVQDIIDQLTAMADGERLPFTIALDDPAGNSFIENPFVPHADPEMKLSYYFRTPDQDIALGLDPATGVFKDDKDGNLHSLITGEKVFGGAVPTSNTGTAPTLDSNNVTSTKKQEQGDAEKNGETGEEEENIRLGRSEAVAIPASCPSCSQIGETLTALTDIPHFKEVIIMAFDCKFCGFRTNEVKGGGAVPTYGTEVRLRVTCEEDLKRFGR
jgi:zinc finger protein